MIPVAMIRLLAPVLSILVFLWLALPLTGQEVVFRQDGQTGREGKAIINIPVKEGQQLLFRVASLDFQPHASLTMNGLMVNFSLNDRTLTEQYVRVRHGGTATLVVENPTGTPGMSFQFRVLKYREKPALTHNSLIHGSISARDPLDQDRQRVDWYPLLVSTGQRLLVGLICKQADARLRVELPDGRVLANDDYWGKNSGMVLDIAENGMCWLAAAVDTTSQGSNFTLPYTLFVRDIPVTGRTLALGTPASVIPFSVLAPDLPPLPEIFTFSAPKAGIYQFSLSCPLGQSAQLRLRLRSDRELMGIPAEDGNPGTQIITWLRANQKVELSAEALIAENRGTFLVSAVQAGSAVVLRDGDKLEQDLKPSGRNYYLYHGRTGEYVEFLMASNAFRTRLQASDDAGQVLSWSNYYGSDFSQAALGGYYFEQPGDLVLEARGFDPGDEGKFQMQVRSSLAGGLDAPRDWQLSTNLPSDKLLFFRLSSHDPVLDGHYTNEYFLDLKANELIAISMRSRDFDSRLTLFGPDGQQLVASDDFEGPDSYLEYVTAVAGRHVIRASSWIEDGDYLNANYHLLFRRLGLAQSFATEFPDRSGLISEDSPHNDDGRLYQELSETLKTGQRVYLVVRSPDFNPRLQFLDRDGKVLDENDDYGQGTDARIDFTVRSPGLYHLRIIAGGDDAGTSKGTWSLSAWEIK